MSMRDPLVEALVCSWSGHTKGVEPQGGMPERGMWKPMMSVEYDVDIFLLC